MFWNKKQAIEKRELARQFQEELQELTKNLQMVYTETTTNGKTLKKYSYTMDEMLDMMEQIVKKREEEKERNANIEEEIKRLKEVVLFYQEQTYRVNNILLKDTNWNSSVQIMAKDENIKLQKNGMSAINTIDCTFTFELHEAIEIIDTNIQEKDEKIADIYIPGLIYQGKVIRKAKVAVYRYSENESKI